MVVERTWILLLFPVALGVILFWRKRSFLSFPSLEVVPEDRVSRLFSLSYKTIPILLLVFLILLGAGFQFPGRERMEYGYGADIIFMLDESRSMLETFEGFTSEPGKGPSKFTSAKSVIARFMESRKAGRDRYGLIAFGSSAVKVLPLSFDHELFLSCLESQRCILNSTILYLPVASGLDELMRSGARSRIIILVSDGDGILEDDKYGFSGIIKKDGIRFYWISLGAAVLKEVPEFLKRLGPLGRRMDAANAAELEKGFTEIHQLERSLIVYRSSSPWVTSRPMSYSALLLMTMTWISHSLFVYRRGGTGEP